MQPPTHTGHGILAVDLNSPGTYLHWSIFTISVANLVLIAVMVVIFGAALLLPFPGRNRVIPATVEAPAAGTGAAGDADAAAAGADYAEDAEDRRMWTNRVRHWVLSVLPPH